VEIETIKATLLSQIEQLEESLQIISRRIKLEFRLNGTSRTQVAQSCKTDK